MVLQQRPGWEGIASISESVFCAPEPRNTKFIYAVVKDHILDELSRREPFVRFVQVGANDGLGTDPIRAHIVRHGWRGLLIEPIPEVFDRLKATYDVQPGLAFAQVAIWPEEGVRTLNVVAGRDALSSFSLETILRHEPKYEDLRAELRTIDVQTRRLDSLLAETGHGEPHVLVIDAEGCDDVVLRTFDLDAYRPDVIQLEHVHLSAKASTDLRDWLTGFGYALVFDRHDLLALNTASFEPTLIRFCQDLVAAARAN